MNKKLMLSVLPVLLVGFVIAGYLVNSFVITTDVNRTVNHTIYVPEYVDKVVEVLSECDKCTNEVIDIFPITEEDDRNNWKIFLGGLLFFVIICFLFWLFSDRGKSKYGHIEPVNSLPNKQEGYDGR